MEILAIQSWPCKQVEERIERLAGAAAAVQKVDKVFAEIEKDGKRAKYHYADSGRYLSDTNVWSVHVGAAGADLRFMQHISRLAVRWTVLAKLHAGAYMLSKAAPILRAIEDLLNDVAVLPFDAACAKAFRRVRGLLKRRRISASPLDLQIASVALVHNLALATHDVKDFQNISGLRLEDWLAS